MILLKKNNLELLFLFLVTFGYIFFYSFALPAKIPNEYFSIPFRGVLFLISLYVIFLNFENVSKRKWTIIFTTLFWLFYTFKSYYSFQNYAFEPEVKNMEYWVYIKSICRNLVPLIAILCINITKEISEKLTYFIFHFLLIIMGISFLYEILTTQHFSRSPGIFSRYYISTGHYGLSLIILSVFYYFLNPSKKLKPALGVFLGFFALYISSARSPILAVAVIILVLLLYINKLKYWLGMALFILIFVAGIYGLRHSSYATEYIIRLYDAIFEGNAYGRSHYLAKGWEIFMNNIPFGGRTLFENGMYPHNIFVEVPMTMGVTGIILFVLYFKDLWKFKPEYIKQNRYYLPYFLFFIQYLVLVQTSYCIFDNVEFWCFAAVIISIILFCYDEKIKSNDSRGYAAGNY
ncbi:hypothetical protein ACM46_06675 [Chryseobacterium angstadtii]|uniref:O-antigen ligase-related domain-containing protein n=1 Tax=Chryseobacterium angstadtii TaxID=558151 RepID=A0A0J7IHV7_9FLAO|nr:O-antigen ligase family protein [Chryseobacterium angstadtii]KMQ65561.1 hypothetical protein ACM46_06675 [Chryseobacterium angstadtii]